MDHFMKYYCPNNYGNHCKWLTMYQAEGGYGWYCDKYDRRLTSHSHEQPQKCSACITDLLETEEE